MAKPKKTIVAPTDMILAHNEALIALYQLLYFRDQFTLKLINGVIEQKAKRLEKAGQPGAAVALRAAFSPARDGEWENLKRLGKFHGSDKPS